MIMVQWWSIDTGTYADWKTWKAQKLTMGIFWPWLPKAIESAVVSSFRPNTWRGSRHISRVDSNPSIELNDQIIDAKHMIRGTNKSAPSSLKSAKNFRPTWNTRKPFCRKNSKWLGECLSKHRWNISMNFRCSLLWCWRSENSEHRRVKRLTTYAPIFINLILNLKVPSVLTLKSWNRKNIPGFRCSSCNLVAFADNGPTSARV